MFYWIAQDQGIKDTGQNLHLDPDPLQENDQAIRLAEKATIRAADRTVVAKPTINEDEDQSNESEFSETCFFTIKLVKLYSFFLKETF